MKLVLLLVLLLCLQLARADAICLLNNGSMNRIPFATANEAKDYVVTLLAQNYTLVDFLKRLGKLEDQYLTPLLFLILKHQTYLKKTPYYDPLIHGEDFTLYCEDQNTPSLTTEEYQFNNYNGNRYFVPIFRRTSRPSLFRNAGRGKFRNFYKSVIDNNPGQSDENADNFLDTDYYLQSQGEVDPPSVLEVNSLWSYSNPLEDMPEDFCTRGLNNWIREEMQTIWEMSSTPFQFNHWANSLIIPVLGPTDAQMFVRWTSIWIGAVFEREIENGICGSNNVGPDCVFICQV